MVNNKFRPHNYVIMAASLLLAGCSGLLASHDIAIHGDPIAPDTDYALGYLLPMLPITSRCDQKPESVSVRPISKSNDIRTDASGVHLVSGWIKERWLFEACQQQIPLYITYTFMPDGRTRYSFTAK